MKYCMKCGTPNENDQSRFCHKCGAEFPMMDMQAPVYSVPNAMAAAVPQPTKKNKKQFVIVAAIAAVVVLAFAVMLFSGMLSDLFDSGSEETYSSRDDEDDNEDENESDAESDESEDASDSDKSDGQSGLGSLVSGLSSLFGRSTAEASTAPAATQDSTESTGTDSNVFNANGTLTFFSTSDQMQNIVKNYVASNFSGLQIDFTLIPYESYNEKLAVSIASGTGPDLYTIDSPYAKMSMERGDLLDLSDLENQALSNGTMNYTIDYGRDAGGTLRALAWQVCPGAMYYRRSLAAEYLGTDDPNEVQAMFSDVDAMYKSAGQLYENSNGKCRLTSRNDLITPAMSLRSNPWVTNGNLNIDNNLVSFLEMYKRMADSGYLANCRQWDESWYAGINDGMKDETGNPVEVFSYFFPKWGLEYILKTNATGASDTIGDWAMVKGPFNYFMGGSWLGANVYTANPEAAKAVIQYVTLDKTFLESLARETRDIVPNVDVNSVVRDDGLDDFLAGQDTYRQFNEISAYIDGRIYSGYDQQIESYWIQNADIYMDGQNSLDDAVNSFKTSVESDLALN